MPHQAWSASCMTGAWSTAQYYINSHILARPGVSPSPYICILLAPLGKTMCSGDWSREAVEGGDVNRYAFHEEMGPPGLLTDMGHTQHTLEVPLTLPANHIFVCMTSYPSLSKCLHHGALSLQSQGLPLSQTENTKYVFCNQRKFQVDLAVTPICIPIVSST